MRIMTDASVKWQAEKNYYASVASGIVGRPIFVDDASGQELGYTAEGNTIYIARSHSLFKGLDEKEKRGIRLGITVHESLHQVFTDFSYYKTYTQELEREKLFRNQFETRIFHDLANLVEDPAIESMAMQVVGGTALKALNFTIAKIDELSGDFDVGCVYPFEEVINALVQFGDVGIIHGTFRFQTSRKIFKDISPLFYAAINEPNAKRRIHMVYPLFQILRKLWSGYSDSKMEDLSKRFNQNQSKHGSSSMNGNGSGSEGKINPDSTKNQKRKATLRKVSKEEYEKVKAQAGTAPDTGEDIELRNCDDTGAPEPKAKSKSERGSQSEEKTSSQKTSGVKAEPEQIPLKTSGNPTTPEETKSPGNDENPGDEKIPGDAEAARKNKTPGGNEAPGNRESSRDTDSPKDASYDSLGIPSNTEGGTNGDFTNPDEVMDELLLQMEPVPELTVEDYKKILDAISQKGREIESQKEESKQYYEDIPDFPEIIKSNGFRHISVINTYADMINPADEWRYDNLVEKMSDGISAMIEELRDIFYHDRSRRVCTDSGRVNLKRVASGRVTTRLFERKTLPGHKSDMCVGIAGDLSSSMLGEKLRQEQLAMIALAEIFAEFEIPLYFMGFNVPFWTPVQTHYIRWENTRFERERLLHLKASGNNFDSYSIRYLTKLMQERSEKHKLMFVLSDGMPSFYFEKAEGIRQNTLAIQEAKNQKINVIGIGIGTKIQTKAFYQMYGKEFFLHVNQPQDLFSNLAGIITSIVMEWK